MKLPHFISRKMPALFPKRKLHAATRAASAADAAEFDDEPQVKLTGAFLVVLILHIVAVGGIYAFNSIKAHRPAEVETATPAAAKPEGAEHAARTAASPSAAAGSAKMSRVKTGDADAGGVKNAGAQRAGQDLRLPGKQAAKPVPSEAGKSAEAKKQGDAAPKSSVAAGGAPKDSGQTYTTVKGDNPVAIAKKFHVPYDDLLKLNKISDPTKLQIGQKLKLPARAK